jgi:glycosyltransferase involved in cell wall biosynthesis
VPGLPDIRPTLVQSQNLPATEAAASIELSIVLPCLNEAETLAGCIEEAQRALRDHGLAGEVIVADNGSTDGSREIATRLGARLVPVAARGYGHALQAGIAAARGRLVLMGDADGSYDFGHADRFVARLREGWDIVMGNRFAGGIEPGAMPWKNRHVGNPLLSGIGRLFFRCPVRDFHCGLRAFAKVAYERLELRTGGMEFASEMVIKATLLKLRMTEIPTVLRRDGRSRPPHLRPWRDGWRHLRFMLLFSPRWLFLLPGVALIAIGSALGALLVRGPLHVGTVTLDVHTLFFAAMAVLIGFQSVAFAVFTKVFAIQSGLLPADPKFQRWFNWLNLERGLAVGGLLLAAGLVLSLRAVGLWSAHSFGDLAPGGLLRLVIPGGLLLTLGCQSVLVSFFLSILGLPLKR